MTPWIWLVLSLAQPSSHSQEDDATEEEMSQSLRVEWAKSHARLERWKEEVRLIAEEMCRVVVFLEWRSTWWLSQSDRRKMGDIDIQSGLKGYAHEQAECFHRLAMSFTQKWVQILREAKLPSEWCNSYVETVEKGEVELV